MQSIPKTFVAALLLLLALGIFFLMLNKPKPVAPPAPIVEPEPTTSLRDYEEKISREREIEQDRHFEERKQQKEAMAKKNSVECQFWKQQKPSKKTEDKIAEHCEMQTAAQ